MDLRVGDSVRIECPVSKYNGVEGTVYEIQQSSHYAMVDMPKGTEFLIEGITENKIMRTLRSGAERRKGRELPRGDVQWFPIRWLKVVGHVALSAKPTHVS